MTVGWVAAAVRGRALLDRTIGADGAGSIARADSWPNARDLLMDTVYGTDLATDGDRASARRAAATALAWQLRVLGGWLPPGGGGLVRLAAAPIEIGNIESHLARLGGASTVTPVPLGPLAVAWPRVAATGSAAQVREVLARSVWGDPGGEDRATISFGLRVAWARRASRSVSTARPWALGALAVLIAREVLLYGRSVADLTAREIDRLVGPRWRGTDTIEELAVRLPDAARWSLEDVDEPSEIWRGELAVLRRVSSDGRPPPSPGRSGRDEVAAVLALLLVDLWRVTAAIEAAGRGSTGLEVLDAVAH